MTLLIFIKNLKVVKIVLGIIENPPNSSEGEEIYHGEGMKTLFHDEVIEKYRYK